MGSLKMNTTFEYSTRVVQEGDRRCKKSTLNDLAYLTPLRIPLMNPVKMYHAGPETHACAKDASHILRRKVDVRDDAVMASTMRQYQLFMFKKEPIPVPSRYYECRVLSVWTVIAEKYSLHACHCI